MRGPWLEEGKWVWTSTGRARPPAAQEQPNLQLQSALAHHSTDWAEARSAAKTRSRYGRGARQDQHDLQASEFRRGSRGAIHASGVRSAGCACSAAKALSATPTTCTWLKSAATGAPWLQSPPGRPQSCPKSLVFSPTAKGTGAHASRAPTKPALFSHVCLVCPVS